MSGNNRNRPTKTHPGGDGELEEHPALARVARQISELPAPAPREEQAAQARTALDAALRSRNAKREPARKPVGGRPLARMAAAVLGVSCLAAATVGGAYATGTRLPDNASVGPLSALSSSSASESESSQTIILHQENVQTVTNGTTSDGRAVTLPLRLHHGVVVSVDEHGVTVEGEDGSTIVIVHSHSRVVVNGKEVDIDELKSGSVVRIIGDVPALDDVSDFVRDVLKRIRTKMSKSIAGEGTTIQINGHGSSIHIEGGERPTLDIEGPKGRIHIERGNVQVEAGDTSVEAGSGGVEARGPDGTKVKVEGGQVTVEGQAAPRSKPKKPKKPAMPHTPEPAPMAAPVEVPDSDELIDDAMRQAEEATRDLPKIPSMPRR